MGFDAPDGAGGSVAEFVGIGDGGTSGANVINSGTNGADAGQGFELVGGGRREILFSTTGTGVIGSTVQDVSNYRTACVSLSSAGVGGLITMQCSNDQINWVSLTGFSLSNPTFLSANIANTTSVLWFPLVARYVRVLVNTLSSGTLAGNLELFTLPAPTNAIQAVTPVGGGSDGSSPSFNTGQYVFGFNSSTWDRLRANGNAGDAAGSFNSGVLWVNSTNYGQINGAAADRLRTPNVFKSVQQATPAAGNISIWTPTSGKKFRLMGYEIVVTNNSAWATGGPVNLNFLDSATGVGLGTSLYIPSTAGTTFGPGFSTGPVLLGNGILSAAANNVLNLQVGQTLTAGVISVIAFGTEE
jgi:hypothetical protein